MAWLHVTYVSIVIFIPLVIFAYDSELVNLTTCANPDPPYDKNVIDGYIGTIYKGKKLYVIGDLTLFKDIPNLMGKFHASVEKNGKLGKPYMNFKNVPCNTVLVKLILKLARIKVDLKNCVALKGHYKFDNIDIAAIDKGFNFIPARHNGINHWEFSIYGKNATYQCSEMIVNVKS